MGYLSILVIPLDFCHTKRDKLHAAHPFPDQSYAWSTLLLVFVII
jgi:hypothetical protein